MNEYIEMMEHTLSAWVKEYPVEWIEQAYKDTVGETTTKNDLGVDCIDRAELLKAMDTWDKFGNDPNEGLIPLRTPALQDRYVPYVKYDDMVNCVKDMPSVTPQEPRCKECKWWKDSDGEYRRGWRAESHCPINTHDVYRGEGYCYMFSPKADMREVEE